MCLLDSEIISYQGYEIFLFRILYLNILPIIPAFVIPLIYHNLTKLIDLCSKRDIGSHNKLMPCMLTEEWF